MKLATFKRNGAVSWGAVVDGGLIDLGRRLGERYGCLREALDPDGLAALAQAAAGQGADFPLGEVVLLPVIPDPAKIFCIGTNYEEHRAETGRARPDYPTTFTRFANTLVGHGGAMIKPKSSEMLDFEGELAVIIGRGGRHIPQAGAFAHVAGYACFNEGSVRDWQRHSHQFTPGKNFPATGGFGPWLATPDEMGELDGAAISTTLNGEVMQSAKLGDMLFSVPEIIAYISSFTPLETGDVISTGTPGGVGFKRRPPVFLEAGDEVVVEIAGIGRLVNVVEAEA